MNTMNKNQLTEELTHLPLFSALNTEQLNTVTANASIINLVVNNTLFNQGQPAEQFYMVCKGQIQLSRLSEGGDEKVIDIVHPGQIFAEAVMFLENQCYPVDAMAIQDSQLLAFNNEIFRKILNESVSTCFRLLAAMSKRLHMQLNEIDELSQHNATYRLVHYLLKEAQENTNKQSEIILSYPKNVLASRLSIKPETFSRIMGRLKKEKILITEGNRIIFSDITALHKLANE